MCGRRMTSVSRRIRSIGRRHGADFWFIASVGCLFASKPRFFSIFVEKMAIFGEKARPAGSRLTCYDYQTAKQACHVSSDQERARCQQLRSVVDFLVSAEEYSTRPTKAQQLELIVNAEAVSHWGVTTVEDVAAQVSASSGTQIKTDFAKKMLERQPGFSWLDEETGWFWIKTTSRNSLLTQIEKVLSVCSRIHISELREGVSRHHRREGLASHFCRDFLWAKFLLLARLNQKSNHHPSHRHLVRPGSNSGHRVFLPEF